MERYRIILAVLEDHIVGQNGSCICGGHAGAGATFDEHLARQIDASLPAATSPAVVPDDDAAGATS